MNSLTDGSLFDKFSDEDLAAWLESDAKKLESKEGYNNVMASMRQAAKRLREYGTRRDIG